MTTDHTHRDPTATDITAERLHMDIEREDHREPNQTKPLLEMFTAWHTEVSRTYGGMACRTESPITLPEAYHMTTEKATDILPKLPPEMATQKLTTDSTTKLTGKVYQVDQNSLNHQRYWNQPPPEHFHWGRRITERDHRKISWEKREFNQDIHQDANRVAHREAVSRDDYQELN